MSMWRPTHRSLARLVALCAPLLTLEVSPARATAPPAQQRERIEPEATPALGWLRRALRHRAGGLPPAAPTDDPHASALTVKLVVADPQPAGPRVDLSAFVVEVLIVARDPSVPSWTAVARVGADGRATFARVPEGRPNVLVLGPDAPRSPFVPDPARYGLLFEAFSDGPFPYLALDEVRAVGATRVVQLHLVQGRAAEGVVELTASPGLALRVPPGEVPVERALAWVASPGWLQVAPLEPGGVFQWVDPRPASAGPFDPAAPSAGFLERLTGGVAAPLGAGASAWRPCTGVPAPPVGQPFVIELAPVASVERAVGAEALHPAPTPRSEHRAARAPIGEADEAAALARWRALRATPLEGDALVGGALVAAAATRAERRALASALLDLATVGQPVDVFIEELCRWELDPARIELAPWSSVFDMFDPAWEFELLRLAREWLALGADDAEEAELALLDRAEGPVQGLIDSATPGYSNVSPVLQLWIDAVALRYPGYADALAAFSSQLRGPGRTRARGALTAGLAELDAAAILAALRKRPSSTLGAELAPFVRVAPRDGAERLLAGSAALARDETRGAAVREGAVDLLLALGARPAGDGPALAALVLEALGDEPSDVACTEAVLAALTPLAPARALADARAALDAFAHNAASNDHARWWPPPMGALLVLGRLAPEELARRAAATPSIATYAAATLLVDGDEALDARGLPIAFLERLLR